MAIKEQRRQSRGEGVWESHDGMLGEDRLAACNATQGMALPLCMRLDSLLQAAPWCLNVKRSMPGAAWLVHACCLLLPTHA